MEDTCGRCRFWPLMGYNKGKIGDTYYGIGGPGTDGSMSPCRRHAPTRDTSRPDGDLFGSARWPTTNRGDWCGDFEARVDTGGDR